jgi:transcriptional regulator with XRE-family HTH domain
MNRIRELREKAGLTVQQLAERCEPPTSQPQITRLEAGKRRLTVEWMHRIATALGVRPEDLIAPAPMARFSDDVKPISVDPLVAAAIAGTQREVFEVCSSAVNRKGIDTGDRIVVDKSEPAIAMAADGDVVIVEVYDVAAPTTAKYLLRQYIAPSMFVPNSSAARVLPLIDADRHTAKIVGVVLRLNGYSRT